MCLCVYSVLACRRINQCFLNRCFSHIRKIYLPVPVVLLPSHRQFQWLFKLYHTNQIYAEFLRTTVTILKYLLIVHFGKKNKHPDFSRCLYASKMAEWRRFELRRALRPLTIQQTVLFSQLEYHSVNCRKATYLIIIAHYF